MVPSNSAAVAPTCSTKTRSSEPTAAAVLGIAEPTPGVIRCGVYLRQSDDADEDELAITRQWNEILEKICTPRGWEPVRYSDNDRTAVGANRKLPQRDRMLQDVESGYLQAIAVWDCDRLYRETIDLEYIITIANKHDTMLATVTGDIDLGTDNGRLFARIKGAVAKAETERRSARQKAKGRQLAEEGEAWESRRTLGFTLGKKELIKSEADAIADGYNLFLSGHHSLLGLGRYWESIGILTTLGNRWKHPNQVRWVLQNPAYAGKRTYNGEIVGDAKWPAIVPWDVWQAVNDILADPGRRTGVSTGRVYLQVGIARCGVCAAAGVKHVDSRYRRSENIAPVTMDTARSGLRKYPVYRCRTCLKIVKSVARADRHVLSLVVARLARPDAADLLVDMARPDLSKLRQDASVLRAKLHSIATQWAEDELTDQQVAIMTKRTKERLRAAESAMEDANKARLFAGIIGADAPRFLDVGLDRQRAVIDALMTITFMRTSKTAGVFDPEGIVVDWKS